MPTPPDERAAHWEDVYRRKPVDGVSWYRPHLDTSLAMIASSGIPPSSRVIDVGGGASTLVDDLIARGFGSVSVLDLSASALAHSRDRLGAAGAAVQWLAGDVLTVALPAGGFDLWHDRAVLHFLLDDAETRRYADQAAAAVRIGGHVLIGGFAPDGPERCSGLPVARRAPEDIAALMGPRFALRDRRLERHHTPGGAPQSFAWALLERVTLRELPEAG